MPPTVNLAVVGVIALVAIAGRLTFRTWLHPGAFFALVWLFFIVFSMSAPLFGGEQYPIWHGALWWICLMMAAVYAGSLLGQRAASAPAAPAKSPTSIRDFRFFVPLLVISAAGSVIWPIAVPQLVVWGDHPPMYLQVFLGLHYVGAFLSGLAYGGSSDAKSKVIALLALAPGIFFGFMDTGRGKMVAHIASWFTGYFAMLVFRNRTRPVPLFSPGRTFAACATMAFFVVIGVTFTTFRGVSRELPASEKFKEYWNQTDSDSIRADWAWMQPSIFGQVAMFSAYFEMAWADPPTVPKFPEQTAAGIYRAFGYSLPEPLYIDIGGQPTNVFTIFKPPIEDFTLPGALFVFLGWGAVSAWAYRKVQLGLLWPAAILVFYYSNVLNMGGSFLTYNSWTGSFVLIGVYLRYLEIHGPLRGDAVRAMTAATAAGARRVWGPLRTSRSAS